MNICKTCVSRFGCHPSFETDGVETCTLYEADKRTLPTHIDWEQRRYEIAKELFLSIYQNSNCNLDETPVQFITRLAISAIHNADAFLAEYQKSVTYNGK